MSATLLASTDARVFATDAVGVRAGVVELGLVLRMVLRAGDAALLREDVAESRGVAADDPVLEAGALAGILAGVFNGDCLLLVAAAFCGDGACCLIEETF